MKTQKQDVPAGLSLNKKISTHARLSKLRRICHNPSLGKVAERGRDGATKFGNFAGYIR